jgi:outer membrane lipoprotein carrier protein
MMRLNWHLLIFRVLRRMTVACAPGLLAGVALIWLGAASKAAGQDELRPVRLMERKYRAAKRLQATFLERYTESGRMVRAESGIAYFERPGKMRWEYAEPEHNIFLIDGKTAWFYVPADHTVTRVPAKQSGDWRTPLALLAGEMKVSRVCAKIAPAAQGRAESAENAVFSCTLRGADSGKKSGAKGGADDAAGEAGTVQLEIGRESGELVRIVVRDEGGVGVEFHFARWQFDPPIAEALFHFDIPRGVAIVNAETLQGTGQGTGAPE